MRSKNASINIRTRLTSTIRAFSIPHTWSRRSRIDGIARYILAEVRNAGADGAGDRGAARLCGGPAPGQRNTLQQPCRRRAAGVSGVYRSRVQKPEVFGA